MPTAGIDHLTMPTANAKRLIQFYRRLGFTIHDQAEWRAGQANIFSIQIGDSKINVQPEGLPHRCVGRPPLRAARIYAWSGTARQKNAKRCRRTPESRLFGVPGRARAPEARAAFRR